MIRPFLALLLLVGCVSEESPAPPPDDSPTLRSPVEARVEILHEGPVDLAVGTSGYRLVFAGEGGLYRIDPLQDGTELLDASLSEATGIAELDDGLLVVADAGGLHTLGSVGAQASPLSELLVDESVEALLAAPGPVESDLWIAGRQDLHLWREQQLFAVRPEGLPLIGARLAWGPALDGVPALWVVTDDSLLALVDLGGGLDARIEDGDLAPDGLAVDGYGTVWVATDGQLWSRTIDGERKQVTLPVAVWDVAAGPGSADLWLATEEGLWHHGAGAYRSVANSPDGKLLGVDGAGRALVATGQQLFRVAVDRTVLFAGLADGLALEETVDVYVFASWSEGVEELVVYSDGEVVEPKSSDPFRVRLDPLLLEDGAHELSATVRYAADAVEASVFFSVGEFVPPTWTGDIEPLFQAECALCHRADAGSVTVGGGHPLDTLLAWQTEIELILDVLEEGRMPLNNPSLSADQLRTIENWRAGGFLE